jgi:hypothetical protein
MNFCSVYEVLLMTRIHMEHENIYWKNNMLLDQYNFKMDLQEVGCGGMDWIELA